MPRKIVRLVPLLVPIGLLPLMAGPPVPALGQTTEYRTPYRVEFRYPLSELVGDLQSPERGDPRREAEIPFDEWYSRRTQERWGAWGPHPREFAPPPGSHEWSAERKRE